MIKVDVKIGTRFEVTYVLVHVTGRNHCHTYDGFGTITLYEAEHNGIAERYVLIQQQHLEWQLARYGSGLYGAIVLEPNNTTLDQRTLEDRLVERWHKTQSDVSE